LALLYRGAEWIYLFSGGLTGAYMIKLYICLFWEKHPTQQIAYETKKPYMGKLSALALFLSAAIVPILGLTPNLTMDKIADIAGGFLNAATPAHAVHYFSLTNIKGACISLVIGLVVYLPSSHDC
ncbi:MAG: sodium:proton antiporter, partial [Christensenellales bacterium]